MTKTSNISSEENAKRAVGFAAVDRFVRDDTCIGLGTGSTATWAVVRVGERVADGLRVRVVTTSLETERLCQERNIETIGLCEEPIDVAIDGADEATPDRALLKGGGGALFREKAVALAADRFIAIVTDRKVVQTLGAFPLPVEIVPFSLPYVERQIAKYGIEAIQRSRDGKSYRTDNGNAILDCRFGTISDPKSLDVELRAIHGVVATGLFVGIAARLLVCSNDGSLIEY